MEAPGPKVGQRRVLVSRLTFLMSVSLFVLRRMLLQFYSPVMVESICTWREDQTLTGIQGWRQGLRGITVVTILTIGMIAYMIWVSVGCGVVM